jgi:hypothetical protein
MADSTIPEKEIVNTLTIEELLKRNKYVPNPSLLPRVMGSKC